MSADMRSIADALGVQLLVFGSLACDLHLAYAHRAALQTLAGDAMFDHRRHVLKVPGKQSGTLAPFPGKASGP